MSSSDVEFNPLFTGDPNDDDEAVQQSYTALGTDVTPPLLTTVTDLKADTPQFTRLNSDLITISGTEPIWENAVRVVGADINRKSLTLELRPETNAGVGLVNLVPRQTFNGAAGVLGSPVDVDPQAIIRLLLTTFSMAGTTPTCAATVVGGTEGVLWANLSLTNVGPATTVTMLPSPAVATAFPAIAGYLHTTGASGDSVVNAQLDAYVTSEPGPESDFVYISGTRSFGNVYRLYSGSQVTLDDYTGEVWVKRGAVLESVDMMVLGVTR